MMRCVRYIEYGASDRKNTGYLSRQDFKHLVDELKLHISDKQRK